MKKSCLLLFSFLGLSLSHSFGQKLEFGFALQQNFNRLAEVDKPRFDPSFRAFNIDGVSSFVGGNPLDTVEVYMNKFSLEDNFEIPLFFRYQFKNRFFIELQYSTAAHELNIEGNTNFTHLRYQSDFGTYDQFVTQIESQGLPSPTQEEYNDYLAGYKHLGIGDISMTERFWLTTVSGNFGMKLFPHKSIRPFFSSGFSWKYKRKKQLYRNLNFTHGEVRDYKKVAQGIDTYNDNSFTLNFALGLEFYRFRFSVFSQGNIISKSLKDGVQNEVVTKLNLTRQTHESHVVFGFNLSSTLFSKYLGKDVHYDELSDETIAISNIRKKKQNWSIGARLNYRMYTDLTGFYDGDSSALNVVQRDTAYIANAGILVESERIQAVTFGKIKRIDWLPPIEIFGEYHFSKRLFLTGSIGFSSLSFDVETDQFHGVIVRDSANVPSFMVFEDTPSLRPAVYRKSLGILTLTHVLNYNLIDNASFALRIFGGMGAAAMITGPLQRVTPPGVNDLSIYDDFDLVYQALPENTGLYANTENLNIKLSSDPTQMLNQLPKDPLDENFDSPEDYKFHFNFVRAGFEAAIDRYTVSVMAEANIGYMDGFILDDFRSIMLGVGYRFISR
jgi:hypothetical protein